MLSTSFIIRDKMYQKFLVSICIVLLEFVLSSSLSLQAAPMDEWRRLISDGSSHKFEGEYSVALQSFSKALSLSEQEKLPPKCLLVSLCRVADVEVTTNKITEADKHFRRIVDLVKQARAAGALDPQVSFWAAVLSDSYLGNTKPQTRETCLKCAYVLKELIYGGGHKECLECLNKTLAFYIDEGKIDKAIDILTLSETVSDKKNGKKPGALAESLNRLAIQYRMQQKYVQAKQLELAVIKLANENSGNLRAGLPAFYAFLSMNSLGQGRAQEGDEYFKHALLECSKIKSSQQKRNAQRYLALLIDPISGDVYQGRSAVAQSELRHLLTIEQMLAIDRSALYAPYTLLAAAMLADAHCKAREYEMCLNNAIAIASLPNSRFVNDIPDLYMRMGLLDAGPLRNEKSTAAFSKALEAEKDKHGYHATLVRFWWGWRLVTERKISLAAQKLDMALQDARKLLPNCRGTLLADVLQLQARLAEQNHRADLEKMLSEQSAIEIQLQKKLNTKIGPDFYHRMQK